MSILHGLSWGYIERWGNKIFTLLVFILLARLLDPKDFGIIAFARLFIDYLNSFSGQGLDMAVIQRKEITNQHLNSAFWINNLMATIFGLLLYVMAPYIESYFSESGVTNVLRVLIMVFLFNSLIRIQVSILLRNYQFKQLAISGLASSIGGGGVGIVMALMGYGVWSLVFQQVSSMVISVLLIWNASNWRPSLTFSVKAAKELYAFAIKAFYDQQLTFASKRIDEVLIAFFLGVTMLGYYSVAKRIFETAIELIYAVPSKVLIAVFSKAQDDIPFIINETRRIGILLAAISFPIFVLASVANQEIVLFLFGEKWRLASTPFAILMLSGLFMLTPSLLHPIFNALGRPVVPLKLNGFRAIVSTILIWIGVPFGLVGIALAIFTRNLIGGWLDFVYLKIESRCNVNFLWRDQIICALCCFPMALVIFAIGYSSVGKMAVVERLLVYGIAGILVYILTLFIFYPSVINKATKTCAKLISKSRLK